MARIEFKSIKSWKEGLKDKKKQGNKKGALFIRKRALWVFNSLQESSSTSNNLSLEFFEYVQGGERAFIVDIQSILKKELQ